MIASRLELFDIQGNVLRGFGLPHGYHQFVRVESPREGRAWLGELAERVTTADIQAEATPRVCHNVALSAAGLEALGVAPAVLAAFSPAFQKGMVARAGQLGDDGDSGPDLWEDAESFRTRQGHILISVYARTRDELDEAVDLLRKGLDNAGLVPGHRRWVRRDKGEREAFGFADGFGQPHIAGAPSGKRPVATSPWLRPLPAGEFLLGYRDLEGVLPPGPPGPLGRNGTYMVYRELDQHVERFRRFLDDQERDTGLGREVIAAKIVGRWPDGTPLVVSPDREGPRLGRGDRRLDDFSYADDPDGFRCPLGAHIRRTNPRDATGLGLDMTRRRRLIRRGMPYGLPLPLGRSKADGDVQGLVFVCFVGSLERQFEFVQSQWCNDGNAFGLGAERDLLVGSGREAGRMTVPGCPPRFLSRNGDAKGLAPFVTTRCGEYLFVPGLDGLRAVARAATRGG
jgi:Dyp-type peroxidase family